MVWRRSRWWVRIAMMLSLSKGLANKDSSSSVRMSKILYRQEKLGPTSFRRHAQILVAYVQYVLIGERGIQG